MEIDVLFLIKVVGGVATIFATVIGVYFTYKKMIDAAIEKSADAHNAARVAELEAQTSFRDQLLRQLNDQSERISSQDKHIIHLMQESSEQKRHRVKCERELDGTKKDLVWAKEQIALLKEGKANR